ncbi:hypothetical protein PybrP1_008178 [[Pythium] brassicae (nom. inval.)]|nr:hypothetical protein PybrP1_008178 [[Pythium] brassicae (nom. inval.)]
MMLEHAAPESVRHSAKHADPATSAEAEIIRLLADQQRLLRSNDTALHTALYEDPDFSPSQLTTLYLDPTKLPDYALAAMGSVSPAAADGSDEGEGRDSSTDNGGLDHKPSRSGNGVGGVFWYRPTEYTDDPDYFKSTSGCGLLREGSLNDAWLLGVFAAIALHPDNLIENLFVSDSVHAFKDFGVYSCRFYKNGGWVTVTTDTRVPYLLELQDDDLYPTKGSSTPGHVLYGSSLNKNEVFIPFLEKAYAKLHGSYQVLAESNGGATSGKILEAFLDCTGGSAHRIDLQEERIKSGDDIANSAALWKKMVRYKRKKCVLTAQLKQLSFNAYDMTATGIIKNRQYIVEHIKEVGVGSASSGSGGGATAGSANGGVSGSSTTALRFVKLKNVWGRGMWKGEWSNDDSKWEEHMQVENSLRSDPACEFSRSGNDGCFWMIWEDFLDTFNELFIVHVFDDVFQYCVQDEWLEQAQVTATSSIEKPIGKTKWSVLQDAEANWHRNPQFKLTVQKASRSTIVWEFIRSHVVAEAHSYETNDILSGAAGTATPNTPGGVATQQPKQLPERELIQDKLVLEPDVAYFVVPYTDNAKVDMEFFLRVFSPKPVKVERLSPVFTCVGQGKWRNDEEESGDPTNAGGPLCLQLYGGEENSAWCQNPQFWVRFKKLTKQRHAVMMASKASVTMKIVVRKTSHKASNAAKARQREASKEKFNLVGVTAVRATNPMSVLDDSGVGGGASSASSSSSAGVLRAHSKAPKTNFLGEVIEKRNAKSTTGGGGAKWQSEAKGYDEDLDQDEENLQAEAKQSISRHTPPVLFPPPKLVVKPDEWCRISDYSSPALCCMYLRKVPKEWLMEEHGGLMLVPSLGEAGAEGTFELQVDCDFPLVMDELPKFSTQSLPGEWTESSAVGCHLHSDWKKNPKLYLHIKGVRPAKVKITLTRSELEWKAKCKRDAVGTMMGFYLFHGQKMARDGSTNIILNGRPWTETDFVPLHSVQSPPELVLPSAFNEPYVIMPATYDPNKLGKFVVSVQSDVEFTLSSDAE